ncbi:twin-arginine translocase TatA/TatE family subunit [Sphaerisporangium album]|uniref:Sec-independent protein translocase protein TatA n=1 Tax=Sphaerisporangium album TaxID=509200 RepID=A0A367EX98_9ACTN|nr:Sec-independent protein translocase subunit TatA [Sphaerisporangium album]RCG22748.1 twin-arginine translocase TatA/TatE family subunit [Sphaerisporangium album]
MGELSVWHWLIVAAVFMLLFGANRLPEAARSIGRSLRIFHSEVRKLDDDEAVPARPADPGAGEGRSRTPPGT